MGACVPRLCTLRKTLDMKKAKLTLNEKQEFVLDIHDGIYHLCVIMDKFAEHSFEIDEEYEDAYSFLASYFTHKAKVAWGDVQFDGFFIDEQYPHTHAKFTTK